MSASRRLRLSLLSAEDLVITRVELDKTGKKVRTFHMTPSGLDMWEHPYDERDECEECKKFYARLKG